MKDWLYCAAFLTAAIGATDPAAAQDAEDVWMTDLDAARAEAARSGKPLFLVFR